MNLAFSLVSWCGLLRRRRSFWIETTAAAPADGDGSGSAGLGVWWTRTDYGGFAPWPDLGSRAATVLELRRLAPRPDFGSRAATAHELRRLAPGFVFGSRAAAVHLARPAAAAASCRGHFYGEGRRLRPPATRAPKARPWAAVPRRGESLARPVDAGRAGLLVDRRDRWASRAYRARDYGVVFRYRGSPGLSCPPVRACLILVGEW